MTNNGIVNIHGKDYMTVAKRVELAREAKALESVETEILNHNPVVIKAIVKIKGEIFTGISSVDLSNAKMIEKSNPYEVAETSAVGRALGFAGYGVVESIASADEMVKAKTFNNSDGAVTTGREFEQPVRDELDIEDDRRVCSAHDEPTPMTKAYSKSKVDANGNPKAYWYHKEGNKMCFGDGFK